LTTFFFFEKKNQKIKLKIYLRGYDKYCFLSIFYLKIYKNIYIFILSHQNDKRILKIFYFKFNKKPVQLYLETRRKSFLVRILAKTSRIKLQRGFLFFS